MIPYGRGPRSGTSVRGRSRCAPQKASRARRPSHVTRPRSRRVAAASSASWPTGRARLEPAARRPPRRRLACAAARAPDGRRGRRTARDALSGALGARQRRRRRLGRRRRRRRSGHDAQRGATRSIATPKRATRSRRRRRTTSSGHRSASGAPRVDRAEQSRRASRWMPGTTLRAGGLDREQHGRGEDGEVDVLDRHARDARDAGLEGLGRPIAAAASSPGPRPLAVQVLSVPAATTENVTTEEAMVRLDMSEYMERHSVSERGQPPGLRKFGEGGTSRGRAPPPPSPRTAAATPR